MPFCTQCGHQVADADVFCANCGRRQTPVSGTGPFAPPPRPAPGIDPLANVSSKTASILCYTPVLGWVAAVVVLSTRRFKTENIVRFHAFQGLYLFAAWLLVQWVIHPLMLTMPSHVFRIDHILELVIIGTCIFMMVKTSHDDLYVLPIIGELAQRSAAEQ